MRSPSPINTARQPHLIHPAENQTKINVTGRYSSTPVNSEVKKKTPISEKKISRVTIGYPQTPKKVDLQAIFPFTSELIGLMIVSMDRETKRNGIKKAAIVEKLSITVRSMVHVTSTKKAAEWHETVGSWKAAWAIIDDVCYENRTHAKAWSVTSDSKNTGQWFLDIEKQGNQTTTEEN